ncbi:MAG: hypothetical protein PW788_03150 [Micavibrio sp.]|nr:hypothetical protein [Micavibrio sp.]
MATKGLDMTKSYCLTVEVGSETIENGLGYLVAFTLADDSKTPDQTPGFARWADQVRDAVLRAGDQVFDPDPYTKKLAIAELMNDLAALNGKSAVKVGGIKGVPAVQIQSTNPYDPRIEADFTSADGQFNVVEKTLSDLARRKISGHGQTGIAEGARAHFPFVQQPAIVPRKPQANRGPRP